MTNKLPIEYCKKLIKEGQIKQISPTLFEVLEHSVKIQTKKGRTLLICSCFNSGLFGHDNFCLHKCSVLVYLINNNFLGRINKLIEEYKTYKELKLPVNIDLMISDLNDIKNKF